MPFYYITITLYDGKSILGIKEYTHQHIDFAYRHFLAEAEKHYRGSQIKEFNCVMISRQSKIYKEWLRSRQLKKGLIEDITAQVKIADTGNKPVQPAYNRKQYNPDSKNNWGENIKKQKEVERDGKE